MCPGRGITVQGKCVVVVVVAVAAAVVVVYVCGCVCDCGWAKEENKKPTDAEAFCEEKRRNTTNPSGAEGIEDCFIVLVYVGVYVWICFVSCILPFHFRKCLVEFQLSRFSTDH